jgi:hypothetical protein
VILAHGLGYVSRSGIQNFLQFGSDCYHLALPVVDGDPNEVFPVSKALY